MFALPLSPSTAAKSLLNKKADVKVRPYLFPFSSSLFHTFSLSYRIRKVSRWGGILSFSCLLIGESFYLASTVCLKQICVFASPCSVCLCLFCKIRFKCTSPSKLDTEEMVCGVIILLNNMNNIILVSQYSYFFFIISIQKWFINYITAY